MVNVTQLEDDGFFVNVTREEAMQIIKTLADQILNNNSNSERAEFFKRTTEDTSYFTICVDEVPEPTRPNAEEMYAACSERCD